MKKIRFEEWDSLSNMWPLLLAMTIIPLGYLLLDQNYNGISSVGYIILALYFARPFFSMYYVRWNARRLMIKRGVLSFDTVRFSDIVSVNYNMERLRIVTIKGKEIVWDLGDFDLGDVAQLLRILGRHTSSPLRQ